MRTISSNKIDSRLLKIKGCFCPHLSEIKNPLFRRLLWFLNVPSLLLEIAYLLSANEKLRGAWLSHQTKYWLVHLFCQFIPKVQVVNAEGLTNAIIKISKKCHQTISSETTLFMFTSQCCWQQEVSPILPDQIVSDHLGGGPAAQESNVPDELRSQR